MHVSGKVPASLETEFRQLGACLSNILAFSFLVLSRILTGTLCSRHFRANDFHLNTTLYSSTIGHVYFYYQLVLHML